MTFQAPNNSFTLLKGDNLIIGVINGNTLQ